MLLRRFGTPLWLTCCVVSAALGSCASSEGSSPEPGPTLAPTVSPVVAPNTGTTPSPSNSMPQPGNSGVQPTGSAPQPTGTGTSPSPVTPSMQPAPSVAPIGSDPVGPTTTIAPMPSGPGVTPSVEPVGSDDTSTSEPEPTEPGDSTQTQTDDATSDTADTTNSDTDDTGGPSNPQPGSSACLTDWSSLGSGVASTACVRLVGGEVACADLDNGSPTAFKKLTLGGETLKNATYAVGRGFHFAHCVSVEGAVYCGNGGNLYEPPELESGAGYLTGGYHSGCAVVGSGSEQRVQCFPENGPLETVNLPASLVVSLSGTYNFACAALANGEVYCWGDGGNSYLDGKGATPTDPVRITFPSPATIVGASQYSLCGALQGGGLFCDGSSDQASFPKEDATTFDDTYFSGASITGIAPGQFGTCFLADGQVHCSSTTTTKVVAGLSNVKSIGGGRKWACAVTNDSALSCWKKGQGGETYETTTATLEGGGALALEAAACE